MERLFSRKQVRIALRLALAQAQKPEKWLAFRRITFNEKIAAGLLHAMEVQFETQSHLTLPLVDAKFEWPRQGRK